MKPLIDINVAMDPEILEYARCCQSTHNELLRLKTSSARDLILEETLEARRLVYLHSLSDAIRGLFQAKLLGQK
jgi:hypothetical protein